MCSLGPSLHPASAHPFAPENLSATAGLRAPASVVDRRSLLGVPLDLHEGIWYPSTLRDLQAGAPTRCGRVSKLLRLHASSGRLVHVRCRATRLCDYCARLEAVEISELLALDALHGSAPEIYVVLTSRSVSTDPAEWYVPRRAVLKALRRRWPLTQVCWITEFTTGRAGTSGGKRRVHFNGLLKGIPAADAEAACELIRRIWCSRIDAEPWAQYAAPVAHEGGLLRYLALHFLKESQRPPIWWHGHRVTRSRGYLSQPSWKARAEAKASLRLKRALRVAEGAGYAGAEALAVAELALIRAEQDRWELVTLEVDSVTGELHGIRPLMGGGIRGPKLRSRPQPSRDDLDSLDAHRAGVAWVELPRDRAPELPLVRA